MKEFDWSKEYSERADRLRKNRVEQSFYKYGSAADNFTMKAVSYTHLTLPTT